MNYATVCSGIEAPTVAWHGLGLTPVWFSEIEPFPCKLLKHHYPTVPNLGDMTKLSSHETYRNTTIDLLCGGTPCQSFSIAGLRGGLDDDRGNLALEYCRILIAKRPRWFVWENVPGVFSSNGGKDFACILSAFTGTDVNAAGLGNAGIIQGELYSVAWRVLDAQHFGVPQRRRRVFVVGYTGNNWRAPYAVLFEPESLRRDFTPRREKGRESAGAVESDTEETSWPKNVAPTIDKTYAKNWGQDNQHIKNGAGLFVESFGLEEYKTGGKQHAVVYDTTQITSNQTTELRHPIVTVSPTLTKHNLDSRSPQSEEQQRIIGAIVNYTTVARRLTPLECERLQGFPDNYTNIPGAKDSPRYAAIGNSMAVPVMRWIGERIVLMDKVLNNLKTKAD